MIKRKLLAAAGTVALFAAPALAAQPAEPNPNAATPAAPATPADPATPAADGAAATPGDPGRSGDPGGPGGQGRCDGHRPIRSSPADDATKAKKKAQRKSRNRAFNMRYDRAGPFAAPPNSLQRSQPCFRAMSRQHVDAVADDEDDDRQRVMRRPESLRATPAPAVRRRTAPPPRAATPTSSGSASLRRISSSTAPKPDPHRDRVSADIIHGGVARHIARWSIGRPSRLGHVTSVMIEIAAEASNSNASTAAIQNQVGTIDCDCSSMLASPVSQLGEAASKTCQAQAVRRCAQTSEIMRQGVRTRLEMAILPGVGLLQEARPSGLVLPFEILLTARKR